MRYILTLLLLSAAMLRTAAQENYTLADTLTIDAAVVSGVTLTSVTDDGNLKFNISKIEGNQGADIAKILEKLPGVTASQKQGLTLNGQSATLYIDGRPQKLSGAQAVSLLRTMPVESIESVELNSYTGSGYQASTGAVINIVTTKRKDDGWNMSVSSGGTADRHNNWDGGASTYLMARRGNVNIYGMLEYANGVNDYIQRDSTSYGDASFLIEDRDAYSRSNTWSGMANVEWMIKPNHSLNMNVYAYKDNAKSDITDLTLYGKDRGSSVNGSKTADDLLSGTIEYNAKFANALNLKTSYGIVYGSTGSDNTYTFSAPRMNQMSSSYFTGGLQHTFRADLTKKFETTTLSAGARTDIGRLGNEVDYSGEIPEWVDPSSQFTANESIYAAYANISQRLGGRFLMNAGVRGEYTDYSTRSAVSDQAGKNSYLNIFPSLNFTHSARNIRQTIYLISSISRPDYEYLYPGMKYDTQHSYSIGNPMLKPTRAYSVKYVGYYWTYARFSIGYQRNNDLYTTILQQTDDDMTAYTYMNHADRNMYFAEFTIPFAMFKRKLYGNIEVDVNWSELVNPRNGYQIQYKTAGLWNVKVNGFVQYDITDRFSLTSQFAYYPKKTTAQYTEKPYWWLDFGMDWYLTKKKDLLLSLSVEDVANKLEYNRVYQYSNTTRHRHTKSVTQLVRFRLTYKFGGGKKVSIEQTSVANDVGRFRE